MKVKTIAKRVGIVLFAMVFTVMTVAMGLVYFWSAASNYVTHFLFGVEPETVEPGTVTYYAAKFATKAEAYDQSREVAINVQAEGTVLLENNGALPLDVDERRISVFGVASVNIAFGGTGSGEGNRDSLIDLYTALENEGFTVNPTLKMFYEQKYHQGYHRGAGTDMNGAYYGIKGTRNYGYSINEVEREQYTQTVRESYGDYSDAAVIVISRSGGEGQDLPTSMAEFYEANDKHYLELTDEEIDLIEEVKSGDFGKVIVLMNTLNAFECGFLKDEGIDAALWIGGTGQHGMIAVAKMLTGELSPEGRLPDTYAADLLSAPAMQNYGNNRYVDNGQVTTAAYVAYEEGIYVGYRYYETRALEEGEDWHAAQVVYPFGYGLSYTEFVWSDWQMTETTDGFIFSVTVTNTGDRTGKDVVELYLTKPYTGYDRTHGVEKSAVDLVGYAKTNSLAPGESETVIISVSRSCLASYDAYGVKTYLAEAGSYIFSASRNAHDAVFTAEYTLAEDELFNTSVTGYEITNRFETEDYTSRPDDVALLSRADWEGTWPAVYGDGGAAGQATMTMTDEKKDAILSNDHLGPNNDTMDYVYNRLTGEVETVSIGTPVTSSGEGLNFSDMFDENGKPLDYEDEMWQRLVECMSVDDLYYLVSAGGGRSPAIETINKRQSNTSDSPMGLYVGTLFPCYPIQAASWSTQTAESIGAAIAEEALWNDIRGWYAPAMDTHRTPFGGRNYEYYSEDGVLAGQYAAAVVKSTRTGGLYFHIKHLALNDQDTNRGDRGNFRNADPYNGLCTYAGEQSIREIYLKPFELAVTEGGANGVMTAYNRIGDTWAGGHYGLLTEILRNEWGMRGNVLTDYAGTFGYKYMDMAQGLRAGNTQWLFMGDAFPAGDRSSDAAIYYMQKAAKDILYAEANSSRVNNQRFENGTSVKVRVTMPVWKVILTVVWVVMTVYLVLLFLRKKKIKPA